MSKTVFTIDNTKQKFQLTVPDDGIVIPFITSISNPTAQVDNENRKIILNHNMSYSKIYYSYNKDDLLTPTNGTLYDRSNLNGIVPVIDTTKESGWYSGTIYYVAVVSDVASSIMSVSYDFDAKVGDIFTYTDVRIRIAYIGNNNYYCYPESIYPMVSYNNGPLYTFSSAFGFLSSTDSRNGESSILTEDILAETSDLSEFLKKFRESKSDYWVILNKNCYSKMLEYNDISYLFNVSNKYFLGGQTSIIGLSYAYLEFNQDNQKWELKDETVFGLDGKIFDFILGVALPISNF